MNRKLLVSNVFVAILAVVGLLYTAIVIVDVNPFRGETRILVDLKEAGGLFAKSGVTYRGKAVGKIGDIRPRPGGIVVEVDLDEDARIPKDTRVVISGLSPVGEQTLDFRPTSGTGPFLEEGDRIPESATQTPVRFARLIQSMDALLSQVNTDNLHTIVDEAYLGTRGAGPDLRRLLEDTQTVMAGLRETLPETTSLLNDGSTVLETADLLTTDLDSFSKDARRLTRTLRAGEPTYKRLLGKSPRAIHETVMAAQELTPPALALLDHGAQAMSILGFRIPALTELLLMMPFATGLAAQAVRDGALNAVGDLSPAPVCSYGTPMRDPWIATNAMPDLNRHCPRRAANIQQRGSYNAPR
jgi:phospholipid/cholesterol/gamma-HCH transport system substrate-binding protein